MCPLCPRHVSYRSCPLMSLGIIHRNWSPSFCSPSVRPTLVFHYSWSNGMNSHDLYLHHRPRSLNSTHAYHKLRDMLRTHMYRLIHTTQLKTLLSLTIIHHKLQPQKVISKPFCMCVLFRHSKCGFLFLFHIAGAGSVHCFFPRPHFTTLGCFFLPVSEQGRTWTFISV